MTQKEELLREIKKLPPQYLDKVNDFVDYLLYKAQKEQYAQNNNIIEDESITDELRMYRMGFTRLSVIYILVKAKALNIHPAQFIDELVSKEIADTSK